MRGAICLYGQPRFFHCNHTLLQYLIRPYNLDVFFHTWWDDQSTYKYAPWARIQRPDEQLHNKEHSLQELLNMYQPKDYIAEPSKQFDLVLKDIEFASPENDYQVKCQEYIRSGNVLSQYYSTMKVCELKEKYEKENNFKYDFVIRARFDTYIHHSIPIETFDMNQLNVPDNCYNNPELYNDNFSISNSSIHTYLSTLYEQVPSYLNMGIEYSPELLFKHHLECNGIEVNKRPGEDIEQLFFRGVNFVMP